jgi:large subunit ribosomal protein L18e
MKSLKNIQLKHTIIELERTKTPLWCRVATDLSGPSRQLTTVNVGRLDALADQNAVLVVAGKVLASGNITKKVTVAAYQVSAGAKAKITACGGTVLSLVEMAKKEPKAKGCALIG